MHLKDIPDNFMGVYLKVVASNQRVYEGNIR